jgi:hypothetical protein
MSAPDMSAADKRRNDKSGTPGAPGPAPAGEARHLTVSVEFALTRQEFQAAQRQMMLRSVLIAGLSGLMLAIVIAGIVTGNGPVAVIGLFWFVFIALMFGFAPGSAWRRNPVVQSVQRHTFDQDGADLSFGGRATRVDWGYFTQFVKGPLVYQLLRGKKFGLVVPRRAFRSRDDEHTFVELVGRHLAARRGRPARRGPTA